MQRIQEENQWRIRLRQLRVGPPMNIQQANEMVAKQNLASAIAAEQLRQRMQRDLEKQRARVNELVQRLSDSQMAAYVAATERENW